MKRAMVVGMAAFCAAGIAWNEVTASPPKAWDPGPGAPFISGTVSMGKTPFGDNPSIPGMAMLHVELMDPLGKSPRGGILGVETIWLASGKLPIEFRIAYNPSMIDPARAYMVRARIMVGDKLLYHNINPYYVITLGAPSKVDIVVIPAKVRIR